MIHHLHPCVVSPEASRKEPVTETLYNCSDVPDAANMCARRGAAGSDRRVVDLKALRVASLAVFVHPSLPQATPAHATAARVNGGHDYKTYIRVPRIPDLEPSIDPQEKC